jgi:eukaryotic-like serine/threonine-protein kinase
MNEEPKLQHGRRPVRIGKYEILRHVASGGMGAVYKALDVESQHEVALKVLPPDLAANPRMCERFRREAQAAAKLRHENVAAVYEFGEVAGTHYLALEFVEGIDLHEYCKKQQKLPPGLVRELLKQAAKALAHIHNQGIVHRDIKPSNFILSEKNGKPLLKLIDLGLARHASEESGRVTRDGTTIGTVDYMSPEQAHDSGLADFRSDIYSLGCTFYHMLAGHAPFHEGSLIERLTKHVNVPPPDLLKLNAHVPKDLVHILHRALRKKPAERYQTALDLLVDLLNPEKIKASQTKGRVSKATSEEPRLKSQAPPIRNQGTSAKGQASGRKATGRKSETKKPKRRPATGEFVLPASASARNLTPDP